MDVFISAASWLPFNFLLIFTEVIDYFPPFFSSCSPLIFFLPVMYAPSEVFHSFLISPFLHFASPPLFFLNCIFSAIHTIKPASRVLIVYLLSSFLHSHNHSASADTNAFSGSLVLILQPALAHLAHQDTNKTLTLKCNWETLFSPEKCQRCM